MSEPLNPYETPRSDLRAALPTAQSSTPINMPASVKTTVSILVALASIVGYRAIVQGTVPWGQLGLTGLLLWGIFLRKALVWQYLRVVSVLAFVVGACANVSTLLGSRSLGYQKASAVAVGISLLMNTLYLLPIFLVTTEKSRLYFGVICPACASAKVKARDFLYRAKRCRTCAHTWR